MRKTYLFVFLLMATTVAAVAQNNNVITLSENCLYLGRKSSLSPGSYRTAQLGIRDNRLSSFRIPRGMSLQVFENDRFGGRSETFTSDVSCLPAAWKNRVSSVKVWRGQGSGNPGDDSGNNLPPRGDRVIVYRDAKYSGMSRALADGNFGPSDLGFLSGQASSIYIPRGKTVKVYDRSNNARTFTSSVADLVPYGWNDKITTGNISGANGGLPPQGDRVIMYEDAKYTGASRELADGNFGPSNLGLLSGQASSIYIPRGKTVKVYDRSNNARTFTSSVPDLVPYGWNDKITTGNISGANGGQPPQGNRVIIYEDAGFSGASRELADGNFGPANLGVLTGHASSIYIPRGKTVKVYDRNNNVRTFTSSVEDLVPYGWNDKITTGNISGGGFQGGNSGGNRGRNR
ncbi:hypothetical protein LQ567_12125 [Niabella pedocola]|uniref:Beta/gamma crystallin 'Greek key' domain-containing protein n=1 Tax=Niabella pedocola TaxID=1752077 RepID=A0ABS8PRT6_9BACT|nr:hypothetical protein [Niabella pedocola]MCD2423514.1 hypothetical protein [Niabella pedocola]